MFLCTPDASTPCSQAPNDAQHVPDASPMLSCISERPMRSLRGVTTLPPLPWRRAHDAVDFAAYLVRLGTCTQLVAQLLDVHPLSTSLLFTAGASVTVDTIEWWKDIQRQSIALVQQQASVPGAVTSPCGPRTGGSIAQAPLLGSWSSLTPRATFQDVSEDLWKQHALDFCVQALWLVLKTLDRTHRRAMEAVTDVGTRVEESVGVAAAELLQQWALESPHVVVDLAEHWSKKKKKKKEMGVVVVNVLLQPRAVGVRHTFHEHVLVPSLPRRVFVGMKQWQCSVCDRLTKTTSVVADRVGCVVYRCAACHFNLCRECLTRIPNTTRFERHRVSTDLTTRTSDRFFALVVPRLPFKTGAAVVRQIAQEVRRRLLELYPHNFLGAAEFVQLFHNLLKADKSAAIALVLSPSAAMPSSGRPAVAWFPLFMRTWTMSLSTLLGPFLRATTMLDGTHELDAAVRTANGPAAAAGLRAQWTNGYAQLRDTLQALMRTLVADDQHPLVVDATLSWLALTLMTADPRRRLNYDAHERIDGFLVNVSTMLLAHTLSVLEKAQHDPSYIDGSYHQSLEPVRVYASNGFPEVPLRYSCCTQDVCGNANASDVEDCEITARDETCITKYKTNIRQLEQDEQSVERIPSTYYPRLSCHEGVVCDQCEFSHLHGVRYKCAFCGDMDLCSDCFEIFRSHQATTDSSSESESEIILHNPDHVFLRIESPIPVFALKHFQPLAAEWMTNSKQRSTPSNVIKCISEGFGARHTQCADCGDVLGGSGKPDDVFYKCANCFSTRVVCAVCLAREEKFSNGNPNDLHAPGHVYFVITDPWRQRLPISWDEVLRKLHFRRLLHPPALIPRLRFPRDTELFYVTIKCLHFGPLATLSRWLSMAKELQELQAFCACDEEQLKLERRHQRGRRRQDGSQRKPPKQSAHYKASKARLEDIRVKCVKVELHLLASANVAEWLVFYARTCRWLLRTASTTPQDSKPGTALQDPFSEPLSQFSPMFSAFPEHFFFDLCDVVYLLGLEKFEYRDLVAELKKGKHGIANTVDVVVEVVEPLLVMLAQIVVASKFTKNPHLRVEALRSLTTLVTFVSKGQIHHRPGHRQMELLFKRHQLLSRWLIPGLLQFHSDMDCYNASNNGLAFTSAATSGDHVLWGFLPTRISVTMLLRYLWQLPGQRQSLLQMLNSPDISEISQTSLPAEPRNSSSLQLMGLVSGLWGDIAKLFDEATNKITTLRQIHELIESSLDGSVVVLPFRRDMLDGYVAINAKQLRLTMRLLLEALELTSWFASIVSGELSARSQSLSAPVAALQHVLLEPLVVEQAARILSFLVTSLANVHEEKEWMFSLPLVDDGKLLLSHLVVLVVRYAGHSTRKSLESSVSSSVCSPSSFWKIVRSSGDIMERRVGDLDTHIRWGLNALCTRIESDSYLGSTSLDDDDGLEQVRTVVAGHELDVDVALTLLEKQATSTVSSISDTARARLGKRFIATLAKDGRFNSRIFVDLCRFLRRDQKQENGSGDNADADREAEDVKEGYLYLDDSWVQQFVHAMQEADEMTHVQDAMEACLGDIPDQYLDPLLSTLMMDPVRLPSGNIVDRTVIARHLLASAQQGGSAGSDPFTREPLTMAMVEPCDPLRSEIQMYLRTKMQHFRKTARENVLATWGLGWDVLLESSSETKSDCDDGNDGENNVSMAPVS